MTTTLIPPMVSSQALHILKERYFIKDNKQRLSEDTSGMMFRVARAVAEAEKRYGASERELEEFTNIFYEMMARMEFLPNSPALMNLGTGQGTASACYVLPIEDSMESISQAFTDQLFIEKFGGGVGFSLTKIRPKGYPITTTQGKACGPIRILKNLSENGKLITQGGRRDGAHMAVMSVYHPDILDFISCKAVEGDIHNFNISVGADSTFMKAVEQQRYLRLTWPLDTKSYDEPDENLSGVFIEAKVVWEKITTGAWLNGEPGMLWLDRINEDNTTPQLGEILATNPCGEQPLLGNESCNLGSINIAKFVTEDGEFDEKGFSNLVRNSVQFLDNIIDVNNHPTKNTSNMNKKTRKIGLGLMGWADCLVKMKIKYGSPLSFALGKRVGSILKTEADKKSSSLGKRKGDFPTFEDSPLNVKNGGSWETMRNAWRLSIAPTGTISMIADCSSGIEPLMGLAWKKQNMSAALEGTELHYINNDLRYIFENDPSRMNGHKSLEDYLDNKQSLKDLLTDDEKEIFVSTYEIPPIDHVKMQSVFQEYVDSGISKTINMPPEATQQDVKDVYFTAWSSRCKGITVYRRGTRVLEVIVNEDEFPNTISTSISQTKTRPRPRTTSGTTAQIKTGHGNLYVTINLDEDGNPFEVFSSLGKAGHCEPATLEAISRLASLALRNSIPPDEVINQLKGITCHVAFDNGKSIKSVPDGIAKALELMEEKSSYAIESNKPVKLEIKSNNPCPDCGEELRMAEGCISCLTCGFGKCE